MSSSANSAKDEGDRLFQTGRYAEAIACYDRAVQRRIPDMHKVYSNRCACYLHLGQLNKALDDADTCIRLQPTWTKGYLRRGSTLLRLGRKDDAIAAYRRVLELEPNNTAAADAIARLSPSLFGSLGQGLGLLNMNGAIASIKSYLLQAGLSAMNWWSGLDPNTKTMYMIGGIGVLVYYLFFSQPSYGSGAYYSDYSSGSPGLSWTAWGAIMFAAYKLPPMFPQQLGEFARPFFGMNIGTFMWIVNMLSNQRGGGGARNSYYPRRGRQSMY